MEARERLERLRTARAASRERSSSNGIFRAHRALLPVALAILNFLRRSRIRGNAVISVAVMPDTIPRFIDLSGERKARGNDRVRGSSE
jgi:hypothetical protein